METKASLAPILVKFEEENTCAIVGAGKIRRLGYHHATLTAKSSSSEEMMNESDVLAMEYLSARWAGMLYIGTGTEADVLAEAAEFARLGGGGYVAAQAVALALRDCRREETERDGPYIVDRRGQPLEGALTPRLRCILDAAEKTAHAGRIVDLYDDELQDGTNESQGG